MLPLGVAGGTEWPQLTIFSPSSFMTKGHMQKVRERADTTSAWQFLCNASVQHMQSLSDPTLFYQQFFRTQPTLDLVVPIGLTILSD